MRAAASLHLTPRPLSLNARPARPPLAAPARSALLTAVHDGDSLPDLAEALAAYLPPGGSGEAALERGLRELQAALRQPPGFQRSYAWSEAAQGTASQPAAASSGGRQAVDADKGWPTHDAAAPAGQAVAAAPAAGQRSADRSSSSSGLSIAAAEFKPAAGGSTASLTNSLASLQLGGGNTAGCSSSQGAGRGRAGSAAAGTWQQQASWPGEGSSGAWSPTAADAAADEAAASERVVGGPAAEAAFLAVLEDLYPLWSSQGLRQLFAEQGGSLAATVQTLCSLEAELEGQQAAAASNGSPPQQVRGRARWCVVTELLV